MTHSPITIYSVQNASRFVHISLSILRKIPSISLPSPLHTSSPILAPSGFGGGEEAEKGTVEEDGEAMKARGRHRVEELGAEVAKAGRAGVRGGGVGGECGEEGAAEEDGEAVTV